MSHPNVVSMFARVAVGATVGFRDRQMVEHAMAAVRAQLLEQRQRMGVLVADCGPAEVQAERWARSHGMPVLRVGTQRDSGAPDRLQSARNAVSLADLVVFFSEDGQHDNEPMVREALRRNVPVEIMDLSEVRWLDAFV